MMTLQDINNFIGGTKHYLDRKNMPEHQREQVVYRAALCEDCVDNKRCLSCGCATPQMFFAPNKVDPKKRWGPMLNEQDWIKFKGTDEYKKVIPQDFQGADSGRADTPNMGEETPREI